MPSSIPSHIAHDEESTGFPHLQDFHIYRISTSGVSGTFTTEILLIIG
jgi:hypothetical protein